MQIWFYFLWFVIGVLVGSVATVFIWYRATREEGEITGEVKDQMDELERLWRDYLTDQKRRKQDGIKEG